MNNPYWENINSLAEKQRAKGISTYGHGLEMNHADMLARIQHLEEELVDALMYCEWIKDNFGKEQDEKWIPVSERLPEHGKIVACYMKWKDTRVLQRDNYNDMWFGYGRGDDWEGKNVTHWMPLPTPPKE